jgi:alpha-2-macroglobulin
MAVVDYMKGAGELGGDFAFSASLNGVQFASGQAREGGALANSVSAVIPAGSLFTDQPNALVVRREGGLGRLYYSAQLNVHLPVEAAPAVNQGIVLTREYFRAADFRTEPENLTPINSGQVGEVVVGKVTIVLPHDAYYLMVEDFIPAGAELIDMQLETSARREGEASQYYNPRAPLAAGWGWWYFYPPSIYNDRILWASEYLPAGTYQLVYTLNLLQPGDFQVLPARSWQNYFPEVQGSSHGTIFKILPNR